MKNQIHSSCVIYRGEVYRDGQLIFSKPGSPLAEFLESLYIFTDAKYPKFYKMDNLSKLGFVAAEILLKENEKIDTYAADEVGIVLSNASASLDTDIRYYQTLADYASPSLFVYTLPNIVIGELSIRHRFKGENAFFVAAHFDAAFITEYVDNLINNNILQCCICGWIELLGETYKAALFLVEKNGNDPSGSLPFDEKNISTIYESVNG